MTAEQTAQKIPVGISSCLLGERVRFDGGHKHNPYIVQTLGRFFDFVPFCPELAIGLGVPRPTLQLVQVDGKVHCREGRNATRDVTAALTRCAQAQRDWVGGLCGYVFKKDSPSCGMARVRVYGEPDRPPARNGTGVYAAVLQQAYPWLPVEEEGRLGDPVLRENFIRRVFVLQRWRQLQQQGLTLAALTRFHARHKLILMSHDQNRARELGRALAQVPAGQLAEDAGAYRLQLMDILRSRATRDNHVNVLEHIRGYLKRELGALDKAELTDVIESYRQGQVPLIVPITLLRHHFRHFPDPYIQDSWYMQPHPGELMLLNTV
ncbi:MAG: DUF523 and DUF1722 domain-containing protein [Thiothrix sp.]|nr:DUF523 and DUF1722 domain-containing protein [Thiothrix sp.]HPQ95693.1 DUF523 and DUF1722 domain-containing protein [Thiolinea sp.]